MNWFTESALWRTMSAYGWNYYPSAYANCISVYHQEDKENIALYTPMSALLWIQSWVDKQQLTITYIGEFKFEFKWNLDNRNVDLDQFLKKSIMESDIDDASKKRRLSSLGYDDTLTSMKVDESSVNKEKPPHIPEGGAVQCSEIFTDVDEYCSILDKLYRRSITPNEHVMGDLEYDGFMEELRRVEFLLFTLRRRMPNPCSLYAEYCDYKGMCFMNIPMTARDGGVMSSMCRVIDTLLVHNLVILRVEPLLLQSSIYEGRKPYTYHVPVWNNFSNPLHTIEKLS